MRKPLFFLLTVSFPGCFTQCCSTAVSILLTHVEVQHGTSMHSLPVKRLVTVAPDNASVFSGDQPL